MGGAAPFVGAAASLWGANKAAKATTAAANTAADAQREATRLGIESQERMQDKSLAEQQRAVREQRLYMDPYRKAGTEALYQYLRRIGAGSPAAADYAKALYGPEVNWIQGRLDALGGAESDAARRAELEKIYLGTGPSGGPNKGTPYGDQLKAQIDEIDRNAAERQRLTADLAATQARMGGATAGGAEGFTPWKLEESPTYRLQMEDTQKQIDRAMRARGLYGSGYAVGAQSDNARRLAANEQTAQLARLTALTSMGQEASAGMAAGGVNAANQMTNLYGQGAQTAAQLYQNQGTAIGNAAMVAGGAKAGVYGNIGGTIMDAFNAQNQQNIYRQPAVQQPAASASGYDAYKANPYRTRISSVGMPGYFTVTPPPVN